MFLKFLLPTILLMNALSSFAQSITEQELVKANRIETNLRSKGFIVLGQYVDGFVPVERQYKKSFVDSNGNYISTAEYTHVADFSNGYASVKRNDAWTLINTKGEEQFEPNAQFSRIGKVVNGIMIVTSKKDNRAGLARKNGEVILPMQYAFINTLDSNSGNYLATLNKQFLLFDSLGKRLSEDVYDDFSCAESSERYVAKLDDQWIIVDLQGKKISQFNLYYDFVEAFNHGLAVVRKNEKVGYIDLEGNEKLPLIFDDGLAFNEFGNATVTIGNQKAMTDTLGTVFLKGDFEVLTQYDTNLFRIADQESQYIVDRDGKQLWHEKHYSIEYLSKNLYKVIPLTDPRLPFFANELGKKIADYGEE